jgi:prepilin-type N-terminal cleavage/methylation domain-containing protein
VSSGGRRSQTGFSMLEVAVAVALLSIVLVGVAAGLVTLFRATKVNDEASATAAAVITYGEIIRSQVPYVECAPGRSVPQAYNALSRGFLNPTSTTTTTTPPPSCVANLAACATTTSTSTTTTTPTTTTSIPVAQAWAVPAGMTVQVVDVRKWVPEAAGFATSTTGTSSTSSSTVPPLSACTPTDSGAQLVTIRATQGTFSRTAEIVKWRPGPS